MPTDGRDGGPTSPSSGACRGPAAARCSSMWRPGTRVPVHRPPTSGYRRGAATRGRTRRRSAPASTPTASTSFRSSRRTGRISTSSGTSPRSTASASRRRSRRSDTATAVRYVANSGMLVRVDGRQFLVDAPIRDGIAPYATSPADDRERLESAQAPYENVDAILVTHWHEDHFSAEAVAAHLERNPRTVFVSSPEVVERLRRAAPRLPAERTLAVLPSPGRSEEVRVARCAGARAPPAAQPIETPAGTACRLPHRHRRAGAARRGCGSGGRQFRAARWPAHASISRCCPSGTSPTRPTARW